MDRGRGVSPNALDRNGLEVLSRSECLDLLTRASGRIGRIALTTQALPLVLPVNFRFDGRQIVVRAHQGTKLDAAMRHTVVAFEVDEFDATYHSGWSVVVQGIARAVDDPDEIHRFRALPLAVWTPAPAEHFVTISVDLVTGRRIPKPHMQGVSSGPARMVP